MTAQEKLTELVKQKMQDNPNIDRAKAAAVIAQEQLGLIEELLAELMPAEETAPDETAQETFMVKGPDGEMIEVMPVKKEVDAIAKWYACFGALKACGLSHTKAIHVIDAKRPGLRASYIAQSNEARQRSAQPRFNATAVYTPPVAKAQPSTSFKSQWDAAVAAAKAKGLPNAKAVTEAIARYPGLREKMVAEVNAARP